MSGEQARNSEKLNCEIRNSIRFIEKCCAASVSPGA